MSDQSASDCGSLYQSRSLTSRRTGKRVRDRNFTEREKKLLFSLIEKYRPIFDVKKNDTKMIREKARTWRIITVAFNRNVPEGERRKLESLKMCWENNRKRLRKVNTQEKEEQESADIVEEQASQIDVSTEVVYKGEMCSTPSDTENFEPYFPVDDDDKQRGTSGIEPAEITETTPCNDAGFNGSVEAATFLEGYEQEEKNETYASDLRKKKRQTTSDLEDFILTRTKRRMTKEEFETEQHEMKMKILNFDFASKIKQHKLKIAILEAELKLKLKELNRYN